LDKAENLLLLNEIKVHSRVILFYVRFISINNSNLLAENIILLLILLQYY